MSDQQIARQLETLEAATKVALKSKEAARKFLRDAGIIKSVSASSATQKRSSKK